MSASKSTDTYLQWNNASSVDPNEIYIYKTRGKLVHALYCNERTIRSSFVMRHMNKGGFNDLNENWTMKSALCFSYSFGKSRRDLDSENIDAYMVMETLAPMINDCRFVCAAVAETVFQKHVIGMESPAILVHELTEAKYQDTLKIMNLIGADNKPKFHLPANKDLSPDPAMDIDECCYYVRVIARLDDLHWTNKVIELALNVLIACLKKGLISYGYAHEITKRVRIETGITIAIGLKPISVIWNTLKHHIDDTNIEDVILDLMKLIPTDAIIVRMIFHRICETGMTEYCAIIKAIQEFPTLDWGQIFALLPEDWTKFQSAMALRPNRYYGFKRNQDEAFASSGYRNLGWVAIAMLKRYGDRKSLLNVTNFTDCPTKNHRHLAAIIIKYRTDDDNVLDQFFVHEVDIAAHTLGA